LFAFLLLGERLTAVRLVVVAVGLAGAAIVLNQGGIPMPRSLGDWLGLATGIIFAVATTLSRLRPDVGGLASTFVTFGTAAIACSAFALLLPTEPMPSLASIGAALPAILLFAFVLAIPSYALVIWAAGRIDPGLVAILLLMEVVSAAISAALLLDEPFGAREIAGCGLIAAAGLCSGLDQMRQHSMARSTSVARGGG
jgi:drug/metabolite transporter (DMT)-like permease